MQQVFMVIQDIRRLDIWLNSTDEHAESILKTVNEFGFSSTGLSQSDFTTSGNVIQVGYPPLRIDLLTEIDGVTFEDCFINKKEVLLDGLPVNFIGYNDLLKNKRKSGRHRDKDDIDNLISKIISKVSLIDSY